VVRFHTDSPTGGTLSVEVQPRNHDEWFPVISAQDLDLTEPIFFRFTGDVHKYRFTLAGLAGNPENIYIYDLASNGQVQEHYSVPGLDQLIEQSPDGGYGLAVNLQDQTTPALFVKANNVTNETTLSATATLGDTTIQVADTAGINVGDYTGLFNLATNRFYVGTVLSITNPGIDGLLNMDTSLDSQFEIGDTVGTGITDLGSVDGTLASPVIFAIRGADPGIAVTVDITRIIFSCIATDPVDLTKFADIAGGITNGLVMRRTDGTVFNLINWKTNAELAGSMYDFDVRAATNPVQGVNGFTARLTFGGQSKVGVVIRLAPGENLEFLVQDPLLTDGTFSLEIMAEGHVVQ
jgi:LysM repeat protein